jgi:phage shock protein A
MALIERVTTLLRANINDLLDRAEDPEKTLRQLVLDMENQLLQVKTQVAIALTDQHLLEKKALEQQQQAANWRSKAELAVAKSDDALARAALQRALTHEASLVAYQAQMTDQAAEAEALRTNYARLQAKLTETQAECERLIAQHRRTRMLNNIAEAREAATRANGPRNRSETGTRNRVQSRIQDDLETAEMNHAGVQAATAADGLEQSFAELEKADRVEEILNDLKQKQDRLRPTG